MIERYVFTGYAEEPLILHAPDGVRNVSLFSGEGRVFLYYETDANISDPAQIVSGKMKTYPDASSWQRMIDVFHYSEPQSEAHWARRIPSHQPTMRLVYLRPEMVSRYVFYHYQLQEERPKPMLSKYGSIYLLGNLLALYEETPLEPEDDLYPGCLETHNSPKDWEATVDPCFAAWQDGSNKWKYIPVIGTDRQE